MDNVKCAKTQRQEQEKTLEIIEQYGPDRMMDSVNFTLNSVNWKMMKNPFQCNRK